MCAVFAKGCTAQYIWPSQTSLEQLPGSKTSFSLLFMSLFPRSLVFETIEQIYVLQYYAIASIVVLYYDHLLTFRMEAKRIWYRQLTISSVLFLLNRYITFFGYIFVIYLNFFPPTSVIVCKRFIRVGSFLSLITQVIISILLTLRTYALYGRSMKILCLLAVLGSSTIVTSAWTITKFFGILNNFGLGNSAKSAFITCLPGFETSDIPFKVTVILSTVFDAVVFSLTLARTVKIMREHRTYAGLPSLLMRDGSIYAAVMTVVNLSNVGFFSETAVRSTLFAQSTGNNALLPHVISVTMASRLILNLHGYEDKRHKTPNRECHPPLPLKFLSNIGTNSRSTHDDSTMDDDMTQFTSQVSRYSTWFTHVVDDFDTDLAVTTHGVRVKALDPHSEANTTTTGSVSLSVYSAYNEGDESRWFDEEGLDYENTDDNADRYCTTCENADEINRVSRQSQGHNVWWSSNEAGS
ncbi:uncharacterized protein FOMMEDRAFT_16941 [Fomitiporia mediterranea MF3/22]|uniref:uncharacterized protein n=1 Tax=Fomitiporia mediterranea (strain MF3/22) TaxID=694068 RepID=UPI0004407B3C|nr:uncharacterized protein FOMMEDRAFT_16941 [Fomitiporia mediterranea MF3/22]EJD06325.1 hypothetical protein FOMMEDRAFT_16941 [Fomitiporia mediterranea MF3/22]